MYIHLKVLTDQSRECLTRISADHFKISVREPAKQNLANKRILEILRGEFPGSVIKIINGHSSPSKLISVENGS
ncbi:MAG: DUF167 family protein [Candidatus Paceibacterota bacterium]|jgi:uncharacterized protein YggU (UPF0235/DUF167 family)